MSTATQLTSSAGWCLRFLSGAVRGRTISLKPGVSVVGSGADCEILLPSSDVQPRHLVFNVGEIALSVQRIGQADARINGEPIELTRRSVMVGDVISLGRIDVQIERSYPASEPAGEHADSMFLDAAVPPVPAAAADAPRRKSRQAWAIAAAVWVLTMAGAWWGLAGNASEGQRMAQQLNLAELEAALKGFPETEVMAGASGQVSIRGFVESAARKQALQRAVQPFGARVSVNVHLVEDLVEQARRFVSDPGLAVSYTGKGRLVVSGRTDSADVQAKIQRLGEDLHPTVLVSDRVQYRPKPVDSAIEQRDQWAVWQRALPSRMVSITEDGAGMRYIQLANGSLYFEGSVLKSGAELMNLRPDAAAADAQAHP